MNSFQVFVLLSVSVCTLAMFIPTKVDNSINFFRIANDFKNPPYKDDGYKTRNIKTEPHNRPKRSFLGHDDCPADYVRLPRPLNKCVPTNEYESIMSDYADQDTNSLETYD